MDEREWVSVREGGVDERVCEEFLTCPVEINDFRIYYTVQSSVEPVERKALLHVLNKNWITLRTTPLARKLNTNRSTTNCSQPTCHEGSESRERHSSRS